LGTWNRLATRTSSLVALTALALAGLLGVTAVVLWSPLFGLKTVRVTGAVHLGHGEVVRVSGLAKGSRTFLVDEGRVETALSTDPWIQEAAVTIDLPSTVHIHVVERRPIGALAEGGTLTLVAADGSILGDIDGAKDLPVIEVLSPVPDDRMREGGTAVLASLEPRILRDVERVLVSPPGPSVSVQLSSGVQVDFGTPNSLLAKSEVLPSLLRYAERNGIVAPVVDLRAPGAPIMRSTESST